MGANVHGMNLVNMQDCDSAKCSARNLHWACMQVLFEHLVIM